MIAMDLNYNNVSILVHLFNKCTTQMQDVDNRGNCKEEECYGNSLLSA